MRKALLNTERKEKGSECGGREGGKGMDYSLAALKVLTVQLNTADRQPDTQSSFTLAGILFQRAWLQGILVSLPSSNIGRFLLDDGTGVIELSLSGDFLLRDWKLGAYVMVVGGYFVRTGDLPMIKVHKIVDLSPFPDREAMWYLEVVEACKLFYQSCFED